MTPISIADPLVEVYFSYDPHQLVKWELFERIKEKYTGNARGYALGLIRQSSIQNLLTGTNSGSLIFLSGSGVEYATDQLRYSGVKSGTFSR